MSEAGETLVVLTFGELATLPWRIRPSLGTM